MSPVGCGFAQAGTYGHECGAPATLVSPRKSDKTRSGVFWARRCDTCSKIVGGENIGLGAFVPFDPAVHVNEWR